MSGDLDDLEDINENLHWRVNPDEKKPDGYNFQGVKVYSTEKEKRDARNKRRRERRKKHKG